MAQRYDASSPREYTDRDGNKKTSWQRVGVAFEKDGKITVLLEAYPLPGTDGQVKIMLMEPRERDTGSQVRQQPARGGFADDGYAPF